jgi:hypothetical protein
MRITAEFQAIGHINNRFFLLLTYIDLVYIIQLHGSLCMIESQRNSLITSQPCCLPEITVKSDAVPVEYSPAAASPSLNSKIQQYSNIIAEDPVSQKQIETYTSNSKWKKFKGSVKSFFYKQDATSGDVTRKSHQSGNGSEGPEEEKVPKVGCFGWVKVIFKKRT